MLFLIKGNQADPRMRGASKRRGIPITSISRPIKPSDFVEFDLILAMDRQNRGCPTFMVCFDLLAGCLVWFFFFSFLPSSVQRIFLKHLRDGGIESPYLLMGLTRLVYLKACWTWSFFFSVFTELIFHPYVWSRSNWCAPIVRNTLKRKSLTLIMVEIKVLSRYFYQIITRMDAPFSLFQFIFNSDCDKHPTP